MDTDVVDIPRADVLRYLAMTEEITPLIAVALGVDPADVTRFLSALGASLSAGEVIITLHQRSPDGATSTVTLRVV